MNIRETICWILTGVVPGIAVVCLSGCQESDEELQRRHLMPSRHALSDYGQAAEARTFEDRDRCLWMIIGRYERFVVFRKDAPTGPWMMVYTSDNRTAIPQPIMPMIESMR